MIVETEAYHESEPACHAFVGLTPRTRILFGPPGRAYVYRSYGIHALLNAVCEPEGVGAAVLIRALAAARGDRADARARAASAGAAMRELCSGPGKLTQALGIELVENGSRLRERADRDLRARRPRWREPRGARGHAHRDHQGGRAALALLRCGGQRNVSRPRLAADARQRGAAPARRAPSARRR